jgi:hypothetical protein
MEQKGVDYDVGRVLEGTLTRPTFDMKIIHRELEIIKNDLHCNSVRICGFDIERLVLAAEDALKQGLEVWLSPEMFEKSEQETFDYIVKAATAAEKLRLQYPDLILSIGSELSLFMQGILEGNNLMERTGNPSFWETVRAGKHNKPLNEFLARANKGVRQVFHGKVTYVSVPLETVDWDLFDFVGVDIYREARIKDSFPDIIKRFLTYGKPVIIGEFGCCTYKGAENAGGWGWAIVEFDGNNANSMRVKENYVRDETIQAHEITDILGIFDALGVNGTFVFTFVAPYLTYSENPRYDFDMASYSLVKSYIDKHGTTYPEMTWEPKKAFKAVADYYAKS